ncbi:ribosome silencing factor [Alienimonas californiensis]|uniref:Ribosomal silencing factor RsfS n=1 Tax=Alienimonas californiensis TaxID=2527989 RepID=A0A517PAY4_9PLAN|nr:ribosome silencing factor [Alienimonas californiensis]QDT16528.1 Ribosomal silencing factor RsfS [Alienimonas californiensis]
MPQTLPPHTDSEARKEAATKESVSSAEPQPREPAPDAGPRRERGRPTALTLAELCVKFRGRDTKVLDLTEVTPVFDYFVLTTGSSKRQMVALAEEADLVMKRAGAPKLGGEGDESGLWILRDYGDVVLHVLTDDARDLYDLEGLWGDAEQVDWRASLGLPAEEPADDDDAPSFAEEE